MLDVFAAVADPTRRQILERLRRSGSQSVNDLARPLPMSRQAVTKHLNLLSETGLIEKEWRGRERLHRLKAQPLQELDSWLAPYAAEWDRRLEQLGEYLDRGQTDDHDD